MYQTMSDALCKVLTAVIILLVIADGTSKTKGFGDILVISVSSEDWPSSHIGFLYSRQNSGESM